MTEKIDFNDENSNTSNNLTFDTVLQARLSRRSLLLGSACAAGAVAFATVGLTGCVGTNDPAVVVPPVV